MFRGALQLQLDSGCPDRYLHIAEIAVGFNIFNIDQTASKCHILFNGVLNETASNGRLEVVSARGRKEKKSCFFFFFAGCRPLPRFLTGSYFHPLDAQHPSLSLPLQRSTTQKITTTVHFGSRHHHRDRSMDLLEECVVVLASAVAISGGKEEG